MELEVWRKAEWVSTRRSKEHERVTESKIHGNARRGRNVGRRKSGDVPFPRFGGTDRRISRSLRSFGIGEEGLDSWPAPVARNRGSICPPIGGKPRQRLLAAQSIEPPPFPVSIPFRPRSFYLRLHLSRSIPFDTTWTSCFKPLGT